VHIVSNREKANRVWNGLRKKLDKNWIRRIYCTYLSEKPEAHNHIFHLIAYVFLHSAGAEFNYGNEHVLAVAKTATKVEREKHRMEAFIRFQHTSDGIFYCSIEPDFNVLPLIAKHFKDRYADQQWIIYDLNKKYGLYYDLNTVEEILLTFAPTIKGNGVTKLMDPKEELYTLLWKDYFKSTNIESRKNTKLHVQHVPKRYWKYLTEKQ
ncbi:MAG: TIGR03915 family putative DNA repair protein, partial [Bacteroidia bacterium]